MFVMVFSTSLVIITLITCRYSYNKYDTRLCLIIRKNIIFGIATAGLVRSIKRRRKPRWAFESTHAPTVHLVARG